MCLFFQEMNAAGISNQYRLPPGTWIEVPWPIPEFRTASRRSERIITASSAGWTWLPYEKL